jgi:hypothetical protein
MLSAAYAPLQRITHQVQGPEDTVAEEQRADEQHGQVSDAEQHHYWYCPVFIETADGILRFGRRDCSSAVSKQPLPFAGCSLGPAEGLPVPMLTRVFGILPWLAFSVMTKIAVPAVNLDQSSGRGAILLSG